jgi:putative ATP-binding cassette transporter
MTGNSDHQLFGHLWRLIGPNWFSLLTITVLSSVSGVAFAFAISVINSALYSPAEATDRYYYLFAITAFCLVAGRAVSDVGSSVVGQALIARLRRELTDKILNAPIQALERLSTTNITATLNGDLDVLSNFTFNASAVAVALSLLLGGCLYLFYLSPLLALISIILLVIGIVLSMRIQKKALVRFGEARSAFDELHRLFQALTVGAKELKLNRKRRYTVRDRLHATAINQIENSNVRAMRLFAATNAANSALLLAALGVVLVIGQTLSMDRESISGFVLVLLFLRGPIEQIISYLPLVATAKVAALRLSSLYSDLAEDSSNWVAEREGTPFTSFSELTLRDVRFRYFSPTSPFELGPVDLDLKAGRIYFIVGGNGSGKTTLIKLILGLYVPHQGTLKMNGAVINAGNRDDYRQLFSAVFADYHLFDDLGSSDGNQVERIKSLIRRFNLPERLLHDQQASTVGLSTGQRKRLALIQRLSEQRPILVFDEWAAEQDPYFKSVFYNDLLKEFAAEGKTVLVVSHDDRYFDLADEIIYVDDGKVTQLHTRRTESRELSGKAGRESEPGVLPL